LYLGYAEEILRLWEEHLDLAEGYQGNREKVFRLAVRFQGYAEMLLPYAV